MHCMVHEIEGPPVMRLPAIPFIRSSRKAPPRTEEMIYDALKPALAGLTDLSLTVDSGTAFYGTNIDFRDCTVSSGVHPAIRAKSAAADQDQRVTLLVCQFGSAVFDFAGSQRLALSPMKAGLLKNRDWQADCTDYGGFVIRVPRASLAQSMSVAFGRDVAPDDIDDFDLKADAAFCLRRSLQALDIAYNPDLAETGLFDDHLVAAVALCMADPGPRSEAIPQERFRKIVEQACGIIRKDLKSPLSVADLASTLNVSERYLQMAFQAVFETGPKQWMLHERLSAARQDMLRNPSVALSRLAEDYQFSSPSHFSKAFRKAFATYPSKVRNCDEGSSA